MKINKRKYPKLYAAAEIMLNDNGLSCTQASLLDLSFLEQDDGGKLSPAKAEKFLAKLNDEELTNFCIGDEDEFANIQKRGAYGVETSRILSLIFEWTGSV